MGARSVSVTIEDDKSAGEVRVTGAWRPNRAMRARCGAGLPGFLVVVDGQRAGPSRGLAGIIGTERS
jgi:hypothetical protein